MRVTALFTGNPHFVTLFTLTTLGIGIPMVYLHYTAPSEDEKERRSVSWYNLGVKSCNMRTNPLFFYLCTI